MILEVEMVNWRAYDHCTFSFKPGLNFIMGPNGKGKTSILEAIAYALTGEPSVVSDRDQLLRNTAKPATVKLTFKVDGKVYRIERTQSPGRAGDAHLFDVASKKVMATYHKNVTEKVEGLIGVSADFLQRIVYMAEGDVFRFLQFPPGKAINQQVQRVLGLTQLDEFQTALKTAQKDLREKSRTLKSLQQSISELRIAPGQSLDGMIGYLDSQKGKMMTKILELQDELSRLQQDNQSLLSLDQKIQDRWGRFKVGPAYVEQLDTRPLVEFYAELENQAKQWRDQQLEIEKERSRLKGQTESYQRVLEILSITGEHSGELLCPVCKKPMTIAERYHVVEETNQELERIDQEIQQLSIKANKIQVDIADAQVITENLREIRNNVVHGHYREINPSMTMPQIMEIASQSKEHPRQVELKDRIASIKDQIDDLERARANFISIHNKLNEMGFSNPDEVQEALVQIEIRLLTLSAASQAAESTLADMRDEGLGSIYNQTAAVWNNFIQHGNWHLRFDTDGNPLLSEESEREFDFEQFSGGEKTALLVIIHTVIAHHFSKCNFLLVDEPLEHLDPVNRRSLMRLFMSACQNRFFGQALITTYEESLVRKYISEENVNIIHIR